VIATIIGDLVAVLSDWFQTLGDWLGDIMPLFGVIVVFMIPWVLPAIALLVAAKYFIVRPIRRRETAHVFLDLLEMGMAQGHTPEHTVVEVASTKDKTLGKGFTRLASQIRDGASLGRALEFTPGLLPEPLPAMLQAGERLGDIRKVLPPCRAVLAEGPSRAMGAFNYLPVFSPVLLMLVIAQFLAIVILPKFNEIYGDLMGAKPLPLAAQALGYYAEHNVMLYVGTLIAAGVIFIALLNSLRRRWPSAYLRTFKPLRDQYLLRLPWRRKRMQRDFSAMLALLLDAEVPEPEAVTLAAQSTDNLVFMRRGAEVAQRLRDGAGFLEAIQEIDHTGELQWRLTNAVHGYGGFMKALSGWHDSLDAKAYQLEQAASQTITTGLIILNGCLVGLIVFGVFQVLTSVVWEASSW